MSLLEPLVSRIDRHQQRIDEVVVTRWATVTSLSPIEIIFDGETVPYGGKPQVVDGRLRVGQRVLCLLVNRRVIIIAKVAHDTGWVPLTIVGSGTAGMSGDESPKCRVLDGMLYFQGGISNSGVTTDSASNRLQLPAGVVLPFPWSGAAASSSGKSTGAWIITTGGVFSLRTTTVVGAYYKIDSVPPVPLI